MLCGHSSLIHRHDRDRMLNEVNCGIIFFQDKLSCCLAFDESMSFWHLLLARVLFVGGCAHLSHRLYQICIPDHYVSLSQALTLDGTSW